MPKSRSLNDLYNKSFYTDRGTGRLRGFYMFFEPARAMRQLLRSQCAKTQPETGCHAPEKVVEEECGFDPNRAADLAGSHRKPEGRLGKITPFAVEHLTEGKCRVKGKGAFPGCCANSVFVCMAVRDDDHIVPERFKAAPGVRTEKEERLPGQAEPVLVPAPVQVRIGADYKRRSKQVLIRRSRSARAELQPVEPPVEHL